MSSRFTAIIQREESWYVAKCAENNVASQGRTIEESLINLKEAVELFYEDNEMPTYNTQTLISAIEVNI
jgi:predicted RNase H-like HicB family nuclease